MAGERLYSKFLPFSQVHFGRTGKCFVNRHKPYANRWAQYFIKRIFLNKKSDICSERKKMEKLDGN